MGMRDWRLSGYPLIVFVHVPKTAGSTIKKLLGLCTPGGDINVQFLMDDRDAFLDIARNSHWIGGHCRRDRFAKGLTWLNRPIEYFSCVREPIAQLRSHLNFGFHRYKDGNYYGLADLDCATARCRGDLSGFFQSLRHHVASFAACAALSQCAIALHARLTSLRSPTSKSLVRLATYTFVASETRLPQIYRAFGFARLPHGVNEVRANTAEYEIDSRAFNSSQMREFLTRFHRHDLRLYAAVHATAWPAEGRRPFRPALLEKTSFHVRKFRRAVVC